MGVMNGNSIRALAIAAAMTALSLSPEALAQDAGSSPQQDVNVPQGGNATAPAPAAAAAAAPAQPAPEAIAPQPAPKAAQRRQPSGNAGTPIILGDVTVNAPTTPASRRPQRETTEQAARRRVIEQTVTVRRREEPIQSAPVSAKAFRGDELGPTQRDTVETAVEGVPNMVFWSQGSISAPQISIRGNGGLGGNAGIDRQQGVGFFIDDVFVARPTGYPTYIWDAERFEVARGSQAVLYGRNAIGGAVNIVTEKPADEFSGFGKVTYGSDGLKRFTGAANIPINDIITTRSSITLTGRGGVLDNRYDGSTVGDIRSGAGRFTTDIRPSADTLLRISGDYGRDNSEGWAFGLVSDVLKGRINVNERPIEHRDVGGISARLEHNFDTFKLTTNSAYRGYRYATLLDGDFLPQPLYSQGQWQNQDQFTQEIRLSGRLNNRLGWVLGGFYLWEHLRGADQFDLFGVPPALWSNNSLDQRTNSYSAFGELSYAVSNRLELIAGLRYTYETKEGRAAIATPSGTYAFGMPVAASGSADFDGLTPEFTARYRVTNDMMAYARASNGFRAGGISQFIANNQINIYDPETVWTYEVGTKSRWFDKRLLVDVAVFYNDWQNQQVMEYVLPRGRVIGNAGKARSYGFEVEGSYKLTREWQLFAGYGFLDARYEDYEDAVRGVIYDGNTIPLSPRHSVNAGVKYEEYMGHGITLFAGANYNYKGAYYFLADNLYEQAPLHLVNAQLGIRKDNWEAEIWAKNMLDERYLAGYYRSGTLDVGAPGDGRTFGVTLTGRF